MNTLDDAARSAMKDYLQQEVAEHTEVVAIISTVVGDEFARLVNACSRALASGNKLLFFGNGGSAADAQHLATELVVRYQRNRPALAAIALTTDTSALTAIGNDFGFDSLFARQVEALCRPGDVAIGMSTSGNSENVIRGLQAARAIGAVTVAFAGDGGGRLAGQIDHGIFIPSKTTARIQEMHLFLGHTLCALLEREAETP
ncbi:MAG TPA: D-sedoheptulose 7-phosphate isomerase [Vicinamibacterales bacterium]